MSVFRKFFTGRLGPTGGRFTMKQAEAFEPEKKAIRVHEKIL
jgi:hypothetical protein